MRSSKAKVGVRGACSRSAKAAVWLLALAAHASVWAAAEPVDKRPYAAQTPDALLDASLSVAPMVAPAAPPATVVPSMVQRWRDEAKALEYGDGVPRDAARAATLYCQAARHGDAEAQFNLAWMLTNARGVERDEAAAAHLFAAAAEQKLPQAVQMAARLGTPMGEPPICLRPPELDAKPPTTAADVRQAANARGGMVGMGGMSGMAAILYKHLPWLNPPIALSGNPSHRLFREAPKSIVDFVKLTSPQYQVAPQYVLSIMAAESNFNPNAVSPADAHGLMQLIPATASRFGVRDLKDPAQNIRGGMAYLRWLLAYFQGDLTLVTAAYNAGEGAVDRYRGVPPYAETRAYVRKVLAFLGEGTRHPFDGSVTAPSEALVRIRALAPQGAPVPGAPPGR